MTKDRARKRAIRAQMAETGESYMAAGRRLSGSSEGGRAAVLARQLHADLVVALRRAGWPVEVEPRPQHGQYFLFPGPVWLSLGRAGPFDSFDDDADPDDEYRVDLTRPLQLNVSAPYLAVDDVFRVEATLEGDRPADELVAALAGLLTDGRAEAVRAVTNDDACAICGDRYPTRHLLAPTENERLAVCPACAFDGDLLPAAITAAFAWQLDQLLGQDLAAPAGWSAVAALLVAAARPGLRGRLEAEWSAEGLEHVPAERWSSPGAGWIWLPPADHRPRCLERFGPGARLEAVVEAVDGAYPELRGRVRDELREVGLEASGGEEEGPDSFVESIWPAVIAYVVTLTTQAAERPSQRAPLTHVTYSFDTILDHLDQVDSSLDDDTDLKLTLGVGLEVVAAALDVARFR
jgi:hypothetical protein